MRGIFEKFMRKYGRGFCALAVVLSSISVNACHGHWYQPKEPEGLREFLREQRK